MTPCQLLQWPSRLMALGAHADAGEARGALCSLGGAIAYQCAPVCFPYGRGAIACVILYASTADALPPSPRVPLLAPLACWQGYSQPSAVSDRSRYAGDSGTIRTPNLDRLAKEGVAFT